MKLNKFEQDYLVESVLANINSERQQIQEDLENAKKFISKPDYAFGELSSDQQYAKRQINVMQSRLEDLNGFSNKISEYAYLGDSLENINLQWKGVTK